MVVDSRAGPEAGQTALREVPMVVEVDRAQVLEHFHAIVSRPTRCGRSASAGSAPQP